MCGLFAELGLSHIYNNCLFCLLQNHQVPLSKYIYMQIKSDLHIFLNSETDLKRIM